MVVDTTGEARAIAGTIWGLVKAFETFTQLTYFNKENKVTFLLIAGHKIRFYRGFLLIKKLTVNKTNIMDKPRFHHRGVMLDTSRHYMPVPLLKKHLNTMMYNKFNVFHWHLVDDQSFPYKYFL